MILDPTDFLIYDLRLSDFYLSTNALLNHKSQFINYKLKLFPFLPPIVIAHNV